MKKLAVVLGLGAALWGQGGSPHWIVIKTQGRQVKPLRYSKGEMVCPIGTAGDFRGVLRDGWCWEEIHTIYLDGVLYGTLEERVELGGSKE